MSQGKRVRLLVCFAITVLAMCNTTMRMFEGIRPFDWLMLVIEALVLLLIFYEVIVEKLHRRSDQRRRAFIDEKVLVLSRLIDKGQRVQSLVPDPRLTTDFKIMTRWMESVREWTHETNSFLALHSSRASAAFMLITDAGNMDNIVFSGGRHFALTGVEREFYQRLVVQLQNLGRIIERPEAYF